MLDLASKHCTELISTSRCAEFPFHNLQHTKDVVANAEVIAKNCELPFEETEPILIAAWFHDTGLKECYIGHEEVSKEYALDFLRTNKYDQKNIDTVLACIEATKMPQNPENLYAEVLADADIFHISTPDFFFKKLLLRREWELILGKEYTDKEWHELNLKFLEQNKFFTPYCQNEKGKKENLEKVKMILEFY